jgi:hypothetical protein
MDAETLQTIRVIFQTLALVVVHVWGVKALRNEFRRDIGQHREETKQAIGVVAEEVKGQGKEIAGLTVRVTVLENKA